MSNFNFLYDKYRQWFLPIPEEILCLFQKFSNNGYILAYLLHFEETHQRPFPIHKFKVEDLLSSVNFNFGDKTARYQNFLLSSIENYLFQNPLRTETKEWHSWLKVCRRLKREIDVMNPVSSKAILEANRTGKFKESTDYEYLLDCYRKAYETRLENAKFSNQSEITDILIEYLNIIEVVQTDDESAMKILKSWAAQKPSRPRALTAMTDEQAFEAPIRGVGSPHGVCVTRYVDDSGKVVRLSCAGTTGDATLNSRIFTNLFALALACDSEPIFVMSGGATLSLKSQEAENYKHNQEPILKAVIGPAGLQEPTAKTVSLGLTPDEAMLLISQSFYELQEKTGLFQQSHGNIEQLNNLESRISEALKQKDNTPYIINSDPYSGEKPILIHVMPLLQRDSQGEVVPVELQVPYELVGSRKVSEILRTAREIHINQLLSDCKRRQRFSEESYARYNQSIQQWRNYSQAEKEQEYQKEPFLTINQTVDFELGIVTPKSTPEKIDLFDYKENTMTELRDSAKRYAEKFAALGKKLEALNEPQGKAELVTFKLLIDSMLRQAPLSIAYPQFQTEYKNWIKFTSIKLWSFLEKRAIERGLSPATLAGDNIFFNATLSLDSNSIIIQPWVALDLYDFKIRIDREKGLMEVFPSGRTPTLISSLALAQNQNTESSNQSELLTNIHDFFCSWISNNFYSDREDEAKILENKIFGDQKIKIMLQLEKAKNHLLQDNVNPAIGILNQIRYADCSPIYFWQAVAEQYKFLEKQTISEKDITNQNLLVPSLNIVIEDLKKLDGTHPKFDNFKPKMAESLLSQSLLSQNAKSSLQQLQAWKKAQESKGFTVYYIQHLINIKDSGNWSWQKLKEVDQKMILLSPEDEKRYEAARSAMCALENLQTAELIKNDTKALSFTPKTTREIKQYIQEILAKTKNMSLVDSSIIEKLERICNQFGNP